MGSWTDTPVCWNPVPRTRPVFHTDCSQAGTNVPKDLLLAARVPKHECVLPLGLASVHSLPFLLLFSLPGGSASKTHCSLEPFLGCVSPHICPKLLSCSSCLHFWAESLFGLLLWQIKYLAQQGSETTERVLRDKGEPKLQNFQFGKN